MTERMIDLRSDTVTRPSPGMRQAMAEAEVGDDVFGEDPSTRRFEERVAEVLGKEAALFAPAGTMSNQIAIRVHTSPGDELLCEQNAHIYNYEGGGPAMLSGVTCRPVAGRDGILDVEDFQGMVKPDNEHFCRTRLVALENTHNRGGGRIYPLANVERIASWAHENGLATHLDGARFLNAVVATGIPAPRWAEHFDTVSICFSKGLGAPVGSALVGTHETVHRARRFRKVLGGGMRQSGVIASACLYALEHNVERLAEDHANARILAEALEESPGFDLRAAEVQTNILWVPIEPSLGTAQDLVERFRQRNILVLAGGPQLLRFCTHLDVSRNDIEQAAHVVREIGRAA